MQCVEWYWLHWKWATEYHNRERANFLCKLQSVLGTILTNEFVVGFSWLTLSCTCSQCRARWYPRKLSFKLANWKISYHYSPRPISLSQSRSVYMWNKEFLNCMFEFYYFQNFTFLAVVSFQQPTLYARSNRSWYLHHLKVTQR